MFQEVHRILIDDDQDCVILKVFSKLHPSEGVKRLATSATAPASIVKFH